MQIVDAVGLRGTPQAAMAFSALGLAQAAGGDITTAASTIEQGLALRRRNPAQGPWGAAPPAGGGAGGLRVGERGTAMQLAEEASPGWMPTRKGWSECRSGCAWSWRRSTRRRPAATAQQGEPLTERETEILRLLQSSLSLSEIASELFISPNTVKTHAKAVYRKLGVSSRDDAVRIGRHRSLV